MTTKANGSERCYLVWMHGCCGRHWMAGVSGNLLCVAGRPTMPGIL